MSTDQPRLTTLRPHPEFDPGTLTDAGLAMRLSDGSWRNIGIDESLDMAGDHLPTAWRVRRGDAALTVTWNGQQISRALAAWDRAVGLVRPELFAQAVMLKPGHSTTFTQTWRTGQRET